MQLHNLHLEKENDISCPEAVQQYYAHNTTHKNKVNYYLIVKDTILSYDLHLFWINL